MNQLCPKKYQGRSISPRFTLSTLIRHWSGVPFQNFNHPCHLDNIPVGNWLTHVNPTTYFEVKTCEKWRTRVFLPFDPECQPRIRLNTQFIARCDVPNYSSCGRSSPNFRNIGRNPPPKNVAPLGFSRFWSPFPTGARSNRTKDAVRKACGVEASEATLRLRPPGIPSISGPGRYQVASTITWWPQPLFKSFIRTWRTISNILWSILSFEALRKIEDPSSKTHSAEQALCKRYYTVFAEGRSHNEKHNVNQQDEEIWKEPTSQVPQGQLDATGDLVQLSENKTHKDLP